MPVSPLDYLNQLAQQRAADEQAQAQARQNQQIAQQAGSTAVDPGHIGSFGSGLASVADQFGAGLDYLKAGLSLMVDDEAGFRRNVAEAKFNTEQAGRLASDSIPYIMGQGVGQLGTALIPGIGAGATLGSIGLSSTAKAVGGLAAGAIANYPYAFGESVNVQQSHGMSDADSIRNAVAPSMLNTALDMVPYTGVAGRLAGKVDNVPAGHGSPFSLPDNYATRTGGILAGEAATGAAQGVINRAAVDQGNRDYELLSPYGQDMIAQDAWQEMIGAAPVAAVAGLARGQTQAPPQVAEQPDNTGMRDAPKGTNIEMFDGAGQLLPGAADAMREQQIAEYAASRNLTQPLPEVQQNGIQLDLFDANGQPTANVVPRIGVNPNVYNTADNLQSELTTLASRARILKDDMVSKPTPENRAQFDRLMAELKNTALAYNAEASRVGRQRVNVLGMLRDLTSAPEATGEAIAVPPQPGRPPFDAVPRGENYDLFGGRGSLLPEQTPQPATTDTAAPQMQLFDMAGRTAGQIYEDANPGLAEQMASGRESSAAAREMVQAAADKKDAVRSLTNVFQALRERKQRVEDAATESLVAMDTATANRQRSIAEEQAAQQEAEAQRLRQEKRGARRDSALAKLTQTLAAVKQAELQKKTAELEQLKATVGNPVFTEADLGTPSRSPLVRQLVDQLVGTPVDKADPIIENALVNAKGIQSKTISNLVAQAKNKAIARTSGQKVQDDIGMLQMEVDQLREQLGKLNPTSPVQEVANAATQQEPAKAPTPKEEVAPAQATKPVAKPASQVTFDSFEATKPVGPTNKAKLDAARATAANVHSFALGIQRKADAYAKALNERLANAGVQVEVTADDVSNAIGKLFYSSRSSTWFGTDRNYAAYLDSLKRVPADVAESANKYLTDIGQVLSPRNIAQAAVDEAQSRLARPTKAEPAQQVQAKAEPTQQVQPPKAEPTQQAKQATLYDEEAVAMVNQAVKELGINAKDAATIREHFSDGFGGYEVPNDLKTVKDEIEATFPEALGTASDSTKTQKVADKARAKKKLDANLERDVAEATASERDGYNPDDFDFRKADGQQKSDMSLSEARSFLQSMKDAHTGLETNKAQVLIFDTPEQAFGPDALVRSPEATTSFGAYNPTTNTLILFAANNRNRKEAERTFRHEVYAHFGLNILSPEQKTALLNAIAKTRNAPGFKKVWESVDRRYNNVDEATRAEEVFAMVAEESRGALGQAFDRVVRMVSEVLRRFGLIKGIKSKAELRTIVEDIAKGVKSGAQLRTNPADYAGFLFRRATAEPTPVGVGQKTKIARAFEAVNRTLGDKYPLQFSSFVRSAIGTIESIEAALGMSNGPISRRLTKYEDNVKRSVDLFRSRYFSTFSTLSKEDRQAAWDAFISERPDDYYKLTDAQRTELQRIRKIHKEFYDVHIKAAGLAEANRLIEAARAKPEHKALVEQLRAARATNDEELTSTLEVKLQEMETNAASPVLREPKEGEQGNIIYRNGRIVEVPMGQGSMVLSSERKRHAPRIFDFSKMADDREGFVRTVVENTSTFVDGVSESDAYALYDLLMAKDGQLFQQVGSLVQTIGVNESGNMRRRSIELPNWVFGDYIVRDPSKVIPPYLNRTVQHTEFVKEFGAFKIDNEGKPILTSNGNDLADFLNDRRLSADQKQVALRAIDAVMGLPAVRSAQWLRGPAAVARMVATVAFMALIVPVSLTESAFQMAAAKTPEERKASAKALREALGVALSLGQINKMERERKKMELEKLGLLTDSMMDFALQLFSDARATQGVEGWANEITSRFYRGAGLHMWNNFMRMTALRGAELYLEAAYEAMTKDGMSDATRAEYGRAFKEMGISPEQYKAWVDAGKPSQLDSAEHAQAAEAITKFMYEWQKSRVLHANPGDLPFWADTPLGKLAMQFKRFFYAAGRHFLPRITDNLKDGNYKDAASQATWLLTIGMSTGMLGLGVKHAIAYGLPAALMGTQTPPHYLFNMTGVDMAGTLASTTLQSATALSPYIGMLERPGGFLAMENWIPSMSMAMSIADNPKGYVDNALLAAGVYFGANKMADAHGKRTVERRIAIENGQAPTM
jgi:hypothetical protein